VKEFEQTDEEYEDEINTESPLLKKNPEIEKIKKCQVKGVNLKETFSKYLQAGKEKDIHPSRAKQYKLDLKYVPSSQKVLEEARSKFKVMQHQQGEKRVQNNLIAES